MTECSRGFRARLLGGEPLLGTLLSLPSAAVAEVLDDVGFDWLFVDGEHGPFDATDVLAVVRAARATPCLVRVPPRTDAAIGRALDAGAAGVIVPQVHDAEMALHAAALCRFPPEGRRGVGITRANGYGRRIREQLAGDDGGAVVVVQAESAEAVEHIEAIARVPGVDAVLIGPNDLAASLGRPGMQQHAEVQRAIARIVDTCLAADRRVGIFGADAGAVRPWVERGATLVVAGADALLLGAAARTLLSTLRP